MERKIILLIILMFILGIVIGFFISRVNLTGNVIKEENYSWTKAICNSQNQCIDVLITCIDGKVVSIEPASELLDYDIGWNDPRENSSNKLC